MFLLLFGSMFAPPLASAVVPGAEVTQLVFGGPSITALGHAGDSRLFVVEQEGRIRIYTPATGILSAGSFLDITKRVACCGEQGLLGLAFHPQYASNGLFFVHYTDATGATQISRFRVSAGDANLADVDSECSVLTLDQPSGDHNGGDMHFGPDGLLYIALGDGGRDTDAVNGQDVSNLFASIAHRSQHGGLCRRRGCELLDSQRRPAESVRG